LAQAAASLGVQVRTGSEVVEIRNRGTRAIGVTLADGTELNAPLIVSAADPKRTAALCDPVTLGPTMVWRTGNIRQPGATARVNLALSGLPAFHGGDPDRLAGRIVLGPSIDDVERGDGRGEVRARERRAAAGGDDPVAHRPRPSHPRAST
jgi:phytoene dehydrogenase-like protein